MVVAQLAIPLACALALLLAIWFSLDLLLREKPSEANAAAAASVRTRGDAFLSPFLVVSMIASALAALILGVLVGLYRDGLEAGAVAGVAVLAGALSAAVTAFLALALGQRANARAATASERNPRQALSIAFVAGSAPGLLMGALGIAAVSGLYAVATRFVDLPVAEAPFLVLGVAVGAALVAVIAKLTGAAGTPLGGNADGDEADQALTFALSAGDGAGTLALLAAAAAAGLAIGVPGYRVTGDLEWLLVPLAIQALGLIAAIVAAISLPAWVRVFRNAGRSVGAGYAIAAILSGALSFIAPLVMLDHGAGWFAGAALVGPVLGALLFVVPRRLAGRAGGGDGMLAGAAVALLTGVAITVAYSLGRQAEIDGLRADYAALYGVALATAGALASAPYLSALSWFGVATSSAVALAERVRREAPARPEAEAPLPLGPLETAGKRAMAPAWSHVFAWTALVGVVSVVALLLAVRAEFGRLAESEADLPRYARLSADLGIVPEFAEFESAVAQELRTYRDLLELAGVSAADRPDLMLADDSEARRLLALRAAAGEVPGDLGAIGGGPLPFPSLPPLRLDSITAIGALLGLVTVFGALGLVTRRPGGDGPEGRLAAIVRGVSALLLIAAIPLAAALLARPLGGANAGWEVGAGVAIASLIAASALLAGQTDWGGTLPPRAEGVTQRRAAAAGAGLSLAVFLTTTMALVAPAFLATR